MERPRALLTFFAAVFGAAASSALGKLPCKFFPLATLVVGTLSDASSGVVLAAQVPHHHASPVLHIRTVVANGELLHEGKQVEVVGQKVLLVVQLVLVNLFIFFSFGLSKLFVDVETGYEVALLEIGT